MKAGPLAFVCGLLFALGLGLSGMTQPSKVLAFLDVLGAWDPSLALVMVGAIGVYLPLSRLRPRNSGAPADQTGCAPDDGGADGTGAVIDKRLVIGAAMFGVGWGLAGYCPGPAIVSLAGGAGGVLLFVGAMVVGVALYGRAFR